MTLTKLEPRCVPLFHPPYGFFQQKGHTAMHDRNTGLRLQSLVSRTDISRRIAALQTLPTQAAALDRDGLILGVNEPWKEFHRRTRPDVPNFGIGERYFRYCAMDPDDGGRRIGDLRSVLAGRLACATYTYLWRRGRHERRILVVGLPVRTPEPAGATVLHIDVTELLPADEVSGALPAEPAGAAARDLTPLAWGRLTEAIEQSMSKVLSSWSPGPATGFPRLVTNRADTAVNAEQVLVQERLTCRQRQVLMLLGAGKSNAEIAEALSSSPNTVKLHVSAILRRLGLETRTQAAILATKLPRQE